MRWVVHGLYLRKWRELWVTYGSYVDYGNVVKVRAQRHPVDLGGRYPVLDLHRFLVQQQHRVGRDHQQDRDELWVEIRLGFALSSRLRNRTNLPARSGDLVYDVGKHDVLVVVLAADPFPLDVLPQSDVVAVEGVRHRPGVRDLAVLEDDAGGDLFAHPVPSRLVKRLPVLVAPPPVEDVSQQLGRLGQEGRRRGPIVADGAHVVVRQPQQQRQQELARLEENVFVRGAYSVVVVRVTNLDQDEKSANHLDRPVCLLFELHHTDLLSFL